MAVVSKERVDPSKSGSLAGTVSGQAIVLAELMQLTLEPLLDAEKLSVATFDMLTAIQSGEGMATQAQVAGMLRVSAPTLSEAVKAAVEHGLVVQRDDPNDRRMRRLDLTARGKEIVRKAMKLMDETELVLRDGLTEDEVSTLLRALPHAIKNLAQHVHAR